MFLRKSTFLASILKARSITSHKKLPYKKKLRTDNPGIERTRQVLGLDLTADELDEDEDYDDMILKSDRAYDDHEREGQARRNTVRFKMVERKYFKPPQDPCLLTWAAKEQIRYLHQQDPNTWTYEKIAESFPITVAGAKKFLKSNLRRSNPEIIKHDQAVFKRWEQFKNGEGGPISTAIGRFHAEGKALPDFFKGNLHLPAPDSRWLAERLPSSSDGFQVKAPLGQFGTIYKKYSDLVCHTEETPGVVTAAKSSSMGFGDSDPVKTTRTWSPQISLSELKKNLKKKVQTQPAAGKNEKIKTYFSWLEKETSSMKSRRVESPRTEENTNTFDYPQKYKSPRKLQIPPSTREVASEDGTSFYDEEGEFLYKVPVYPVNKE